MGKPVFDAYFCGMLYPKIALARWVVAYCKAYGIHRIVLSPGSRNAPLLLGFSQDPFFSCVQVVDERSAGFIALGMAQVSLQPVALVCTSGSALANYYPAVLEAHYSHIPLLVLSADRPPYMWERADGQTIVQHDFFKPHIRFSATLPMDDDALPNWYRERAQHPLPEDPQETVLAQKKLFDQAFASLVQDHGPVHLNLPFEEPLYATQPTTETVLVKAYLPHSPKVATEIWELFFQDWQNSSRTMVLVGMDLSSQEHQSAMTWLAEHPGVLVVTENTSNLHHQYAIDAIDQLIGPMELSTQSSAWMAELQPDLLITWGGPVISKKNKAVFAHPL
ncbi:MAG: 2-succinyl-5-enolpyruvyl-6-hydroxy-3-cyclohexene-1-carboxylic-acid synthase, partial [Flavobacteriaceae bacterium]